MDWFWRKIGYDDGMSDIDPTLREYLKKEAPKRYTPTTAKAPEPSSYTERLAQGEKPLAEAVAYQSTPAASSSVARDRPLPKESLFQDGRYAHLWKNYRSAAEVEQAGKGESERLHDVLGGMKERQIQLNKAALENCADEQWKLHDCFRNGDWGDRMTMCRKYTQKLQRCMETQGQLLRALGYQSFYQRPEEESERMQMHADKLYQTMLAQEAEAKEAKEKGLPAPRHEPLFDTMGDTPAPQGRNGAVTFDSLPKDVQEKLVKERFEGLEGPALQLAKKTLDAEIAHNQSAVATLQDFYVKQRLDRLERKEQGKLRISDRIGMAFDMRDWSWLNEEEELRKRRQASEAAKAETPPPK